MAGTLLVLSLVIINLLGSSANEGASLLNAAGKGNLEELKGILDRGVDLDFSQRSGKTALIFASKNGHLDIVTQLLDRGANIDAKDRFGGTALHYAASENHLDVIKELLDRGANIEAQNKEGETSLHWAAGENCLDVIKELVERGANVDAHDKAGWTALHMAALENHLDIVKELLDRGANALAKENVFGRTALDLARKEGHAGMMRVLKMSEDQQRSSSSKAVKSCANAPNTLLLTLGATTIFGIVMSGRICQHFGLMF